MSQNDDKQNRRENQIEIVFDQHYSVLTIANLVLRSSPNMFQKRLVSGDCWTWGREIASNIAEGRIAAMAVFTMSPRILNYLANKTPGVRAVVVSSTREIELSAYELNPNMFITEMYDRTLYEVLFLLRTLQQYPDRATNPKVPHYQEYDIRANR
jgi:hypothetical protein